MSEVEIWAAIPEFPEYEISNLGHVYSVSRDIEMRTSETREGDIKISLMGYNRRRTMSVKYLVAEAFVFQPLPLFNAVINLDGNRRNVKATNLAWRPKWFAWKWVRQFKNVEHRYYETLEIYEFSEGITYSSIIDASTSTGALMDDIWRSCMVGGVVFPDDLVFSIL